MGACQRINIFPDNKDNIEKVINDFNTFTNTIVNLYGPKRELNSVIPEIAFANSWVSSTKYEEAL